MWRLLIMASLLVWAPGASGGWTPAGPATGVAADGAKAGGAIGGGARAGAADYSARQAPTCSFGRIEAAVTLDEPDNSMSVRARISLNTGRDTSYIFFRLRPDLTVRAVTEEGGGALSFDWYFPSFFNVSLGRTVPAQTALNMTVDYDGTVNNTPDGGASYWDHVGPEGSWVRTYGDYFPSDEDRSRTPSRLSVTAPADKTVVSSERLLGRTEDPAAGTATTVWAADRPASGISFLAGNLTRSGFDLGGHRYDLYFRPDHAGAAASYAAELASSSAFYTAQFGGPGFGNLSVAEVPSTFSAWGQSMPSMMWLASRNFDGPLPYRILSHELAHQWWGIDVEGRGAGENFLQEGFAGYSEAMYEMATYGQKGYLEYCRQQYIGLFVNGPGPEPALMSNDYDLASYKGPWVLHMMRSLVGDGAFNSTLAAFHRDRSGGTADQRDFLDEVSKTTGKDLSMFYYMWLYSSGRLDYAVTDAVVLQGPSGANRVRVCVESRGALGDLPMDLGLLYEGSRVGLAPAAWDGAGACVTLEQDVDHPVDAVKLDPSGWLLDAYPSNNEAPTRDGFYDLTLDGLDLPAAAPEENGSFPVTAELALNTTEGPQEVEVRLLVDGAPAGDATVAVAPGGRAAANFTLALGAGEHSLTAVADPRGLLFERNGADDRASARLSVRPRPPVLPDLGIPPGGVTVRPDGVAGGLPAILEVRVSNSGGAPAVGAAVDAWVDDPQTGYAGRSLPFSVDPSGTVLAQVPWTAVSGWHQLTARVVMPAGVEDQKPTDNEATVQAYVNTPPAAVLSAPVRQARPGDWVELSGALSVDDGRVTHYLFDFGDGGDTGWLAEGATSHAYMAKGTYGARLRVQDDLGAESDWSAPVVIRVSSLPPVAAIRGAALRMADVLSNVSFASASADADGNVSSLAWSFGDGGMARGPAVNHTWSRKGDFTVTLTAADDEGHSSSASVLVRVEDLPPLPSISHGSGPFRVGQRVAFGAGGTTDPDDPLPALSYIWDFGGGQKASGPNASYAFSGPGWHRVILTASDGNLSAGTWAEVQVRTAAPAVTAEGAGPVSWVILGLLLASMAGLTVYIIYPFKPRIGEEEE
jgi:hypothetical protein